MLNIINSRMKMAFSTKRAEAGLLNNKGKMEKRILVISSEIGKLASVKAVTWSEELPNIADFDVVIMDLVSLYSDVENNRIKLNNLRSPNKEAVSKLIESGGELIVISYPATRLTQYVPESVSGQNTGVVSGVVPGTRTEQFTMPKSPHDNLYWWSPIPIKNILEEGSSVSIKDARFQEYIEQGIKKWSYYLELRKRQETFIPDSGYANCDYWRDYNVEPIALNGYSKPIAASFSITVKAKPRYAFGESDARVISTSGPLIILPPPTECTIEESIRFILAKLYGVALESVEPEWLQNYNVPGENDLEEEIRSLELRIEEDKREVEQKNKQMKDLTRVKKVLTETGDVLEEIVWETLEELGATVKSPDEPGKSDAKFTDYNGRKAVLEIKGRMKSIALDDVRQLEQRVTDELAKGEDYKGILFGNPFREDPPEKRREPFPPNVRSFAKKRHQCIVTTVQLFEAFKRVKAGEMKAKAIFDKLMETDGVCELISD